jgi:alkyl hydroperoxide reductase subunit F
MYDVIIVGAGPAGLAASIYFARQKMKFAVVTKDVGGQTLLSADVENYLGFHLVDGTALVGAFRAHLKDYKGQFELKEGEEVAGVERMDGGFRIVTNKAAYETKTVLIASGEKHRELKVPGEREFYGRGVTYCATCDAPLYGGKEVVVIGGGNSAMEAALFLEKYATKVTILTINDKLMGDSTMQKKIGESAKISLVTKAKTTKILGDTFVTGIEYQDATGAGQVMKTQGIFIEIGLVPISEFIDIVKKNKWNEIEVNLSNETSVPGIWAAGDVTNVTEKQIAVAVGEGSKAALSIIRWFERHEGMPESKGY